MSPESPKPCNSSTAGPDPPTRTCNVPPVTTMSRALKSAENGLTSARVRAGTPPKSAAANSQGSTGKEDLHCAVQDSVERPRQVSCQKPPSLRRLRQIVSVGQGVDAVRPELAIAVAILLLIAAVMFYT